MAKKSKEMLEIDEIIMKMKDPKYVPEYTLDMMRDVIMANTAGQVTSAFNVICSELNYRPTLLQEDKDGIIKATLYDVAKKWELVARAIKEIAEKLPDELPTAEATLREEDLERIGNEAKRWNQAMRNFLDRREELEKKKYPWGDFLEDGVTLAASYMTDVLAGRLGGELTDEQKYSITDQFEEIISGAIAEEADRIAAEASEA